jgi:hypothetical protein
MAELSRVLQQGVQLMIATYLYPQRERSVPLLSAKAKISRARKVDQTIARGDCSWPVYFSWWGVRKHTSQVIATEVRLSSAGSRQISRLLFEFCPA